MREHAQPFHLRVSSGVGWNLIGAVFNQGSTFVVNVLLANVLGMEAYGAYAIVLSTISVLGLAAQLSTGYTATKYVAEFRLTDPERAGRILRLLTVMVVVGGLAMAAGLAIGATWVARRLLDAPALAWPLLLAAPGVFFTSVNGFLLGALAGLERYSALGRTGMASGIGYVILGAGGGVAAGLYGALAGIVFAGLLQMTLLSRAVWSAAREQGVVTRRDGATGDARIVWTFTLPAAVGTLVSMSAVWFGNASLVREPGGYALMALFAAANNFRIIVLFLPGVLNNVTMSILNNQRGIGDVRRYKSLFRVNLAVTIAIVVSGASFVALFGPWLLRLFGREFAGGYGVLLVLMLATLPEGLSVALYQALQSRERLWLALTAVTVPGYAVLAAAAWWWIPTMGAVGLARAYLAGWCVAAVMSALIVSRMRSGRVDDVVTPW